MSNRNPWLALLFALVLMFFVGQLLFAPKTYVVSRLGQAFQAPIIFLKNLATQVNIYEQLQGLQRENLGLRAQLIQSLSRPELIKDGKERYISAELYSRYPFNVADQIFISSGKVDGVASGSPVLVEKGIFLAQITTVSEKSAVARTVLSSGWELPVKIGDDRIDALLVGGFEPKLTLVSKKKPISGGEVIILASRDFPYGLTIGRVGEVSETAEGVFREATVVLPYDLNDLRRILVRIQ
jgi:cell shape-determining protein MreC